MITFTSVLLGNLTEGKKSLEHFQRVFWWKNTPHVKIKTFCENVFISMYFWWVSSVNLPSSYLMYCQPDCLLFKPNSCLPGGLPESSSWVARMLSVGINQHGTPYPRGNKRHRSTFKPVGHVTQWDISCPAPGSCYVTVLRSVHVTQQRTAA